MPLCQKFEQIQWVTRLVTWMHLGIEEVYFFLHQPTDHNMPEFAARFIDRLNSVAQLELPKWKPMTQGEQLGFF